MLLCPFVCSQEPKRVQTTKFRHYSPKALIKAIKIVMHKNIMRFGDIIMEQLRGITMGLSPAHSIANRYVIIHKLNEILKFVGLFIFFICRFMDDGLDV